MSSTYTVTIHENTAEQLADGKSHVLKSGPLYSQTFPTLDAGALIAFLNAPKKPKRIYKKRGRGMADVGPSKPNAR